MRFEWDAAKARLNLAKHRISFEASQQVFYDAHALSRIDRVVDDEPRWQTIGVIGEGVTILVAHTYLEKDGEEVIRIISSRKATTSEKRSYEEGNWPHS